LAGKALLIDIAPNSLAGRIYGNPQVEEQYRCCFGLNTHYRSQLESAGLLTTGIEAGEEQSYGEPRILELPSHSFFVATLFVPQMRSTLTAPHPLIKAFLQAGVGHLEKRLN
jgi:CTP synthase (UTP-ammonia lyase)